MQASWRLTTVWIRYHVTFRGFFFFFLTQPCIYFQERGFVLPTPCFQCIIFSWLELWKDLLSNKVQCSEIPAC